MYASRGRNTLLCAERFEYILETQRRIHDRMLRVRTHCAVIRSDHYDIVCAHVDDIRFETVLGTSVDTTQCE